MIRHSISCTILYITYYDMLTFRDHAFTDLSGYVHKICGQISPLNYFFGVCGNTERLILRKGGRNCCFSGYRKNYLNQRGAEKNTLMPQKSLRRPICERPGISVQEIRQKQDFSTEMMTIVDSFVKALGKTGGKVQPGGVLT